MRVEFFSSLYEIAAKDDRVILLVSDTGALVLDKFSQDKPDQFINVGIAEANMVGVAAGLAKSGKIVYIYAIIPFVTMRVFDQIRVDVCCDNLPVKAVGVGAGMDYSTLGPTHHALEDIALMRSLPQMTILSPCDSLSSAAFAQLSYETPGPVYIRLERYTESPVYSNPSEDFTDGLKILRKGGDLCIIATGRMVVTAQKAADELSHRSIDATVIDLYRIKPLNVELLTKAISGLKVVATLEEHSIIGGIGSAVSEVIAESGQAFQFKRLGLPDRFCRQYGTRKYLHTLNNLDASQVTSTILQMLK